MFYFDKPLSCKHFNNILNSLIVTPRNTNSNLNVFFNEPLSCKRGSPFVFCYLLFVNRIKTFLKSNLNVLIWRTSVMQAWFTMKKFTSKVSVQVRLIWTNIFNVSDKYLLMSMYPKIICQCINALGLNFYISDTLKFYVLVSPTAHLCLFILKIISNDSISYFSN